MVFIQQNEAKLLPQYLAALSVCGSAFAIGNVLGWSSPAQAPILNGTYGFPVSEIEFSWISSLATLGSALVCIPTGFWIKALGLKLTMLILVLPFTLGYVLLIWAQNVAMLCVSRFLIGAAAGAFCVAAPMYTAEIAQKEIRGTLGSFFQFLLVTGLLCTYVIGYFLELKIMTIITALVPLIFAAMFVFMPESPIALIRKNKGDQAIKSLQWLRGSQYNYQAELQELQEEQADIKKSQKSFLTIFSRRATVKALIISIGLQFFQQMSGVNAVIFYGADIFKDAETGIDENISTIIIAFIQVVATFVSTIVVDKLGRRKLLLCSGTVMSASTIALGVYFYLKKINYEHLSSISWLPVVSLCTFSILFSIGFGPIPWLIVPELFASDARGFASSFSSTTNWVCAFIVTKSFIYMKNSMGPHGAFWLFSGISFLSVFFVFFLVPETKGKSLHEIQLELEGKRGQIEHMERNTSNNTA